MVMLVAALLVECSNWLAAGVVVGVSGAVVVVQVNFKVNTTTAVMMIAPLHLKSFW